MLLSFFVSKDTHNFARPFREVDHGILKKEFDDMNVLLAEVMALYFNFAEFTSQFGSDCNFLFFKKNPWKKTLRNNIGGERSME